MKIIFSKKCLEYGYGHIESPERIIKAYEILKENGYEFIEPEPAREEDILKVHDISYIKLLKEGLIEDEDTPAYPNIYEYARLAAGGAILAAKINGFSLMRPPGHHAGRKGIALGAPTRGFCYLNNIAIAVKYLNKPTLILDLDGHHGNGTQEIFFGDPNVIYISLHKHPLYPGTGLYSEANCYNYPLDYGEEKYIKTLKKALEKIDMNKIEVIAVSIGFDTFIGDIASLGLNEKSFEEIGKILSSLNKPIFFVLEGGYIGENIGKGIIALLKYF
ncbi:MAG: histone deacetylase [Candidatus Methanomethylicota archaeon]|jgi:acetoin utilization deacetylase AcuC-like enzyme|uniref:Histone deacetylase n=1 Tax=Thermoproteota archaeon TaxID=2056631 RepID=A0A520KGC0_9CREN|nr:MAG: histone deacetylase [Candidatus Verstraetearchaeota archaeon]TDA38711.1 MAG: histone deacetylase [Candidatus Verstraetearchaeota archaeon]